MRVLVVASLRSDEGLTLETSALYSLRWPIYIFNLVDTTKLPYYTRAKSFSESFSRSQNFFPSPKRVCPRATCRRQKLKFCLVSATRNELSCDLSPILDAGRRFGGHIATERFGLVETCRHNNTSSWNQELPNQNKQKCTRSTEVIF